MGFLYFIGILALAGACVFGAVHLLGSRPTGPITPLTLIITATSEAQLAIFTGALSSAGIWYRLEDRSIMLPHTGPAPMGLRQIHIWVRDEDLEGAQAVLGFGEGDAEDHETEIAGEDYTTGDVRG